MNMTPTLAGGLMRRARKLLRAGRLTHRQFLMLDCMVWSCRAPNSERLAVSYSRLCALARVSRSTVAAGIAALLDLGLLAKIKRRVRVIWGGGMASRQATNVYVLLLRTESAERPVLKGQVKKSSSGIEDALARLARTLRESTQKSRRPERSGGPDNGGHLPG